MAAARNTPNQSTHRPVGVVAGMSFRIEQHIDAGLAELGRHVATCLPLTAGIGALQPLQVVVRLKHPLRAVRLRTARSSGFTSLKCGQLGLEHCQFAD